MDELYFLDKGPRLSKSLACYVILYVLRVKNRASLTAFLTLHRHIRTIVQNQVRAGLKDQETVDRRIKKSSNFISICFLYAAISLNASVPKDYILLYIMERYYGTLNTPKSPMLVSPTTGKIFKLDYYYKSGWVHTLYRNKHMLIFPLLYAQLLSNYLTPTQYRLNQKYLSKAIKNWILNPIWINFHMGRWKNHLNWSGIAASYASHNAYLMLYMLLTNFKGQVLSKLDFSTFLPFNRVSFRKWYGSWLIFSLNRGNAIANLLYATCLTSMLLLSVTLPILTAGGIIQRFYKAEAKNFIKIYVKLVGFLSALTMMSVNLAMPLLISKLRSKPANWSHLRYLGPSFFNGVNGYLLNLIALSKWRILKENHPWFTVLRVGTWQRIESAVLCYLMWELMNLNDFVNGNIETDKVVECRRVKDDRLMRVVNKIMS